MEKQQVSAFQSDFLERRKSVFRKLITDISEHLLPGEVAKCMFLRKVPKERAASALQTLDYLMQGGEFSHSNVEPLTKLLQDINRHDLVNELVQPFLKECSEEELSQSVPVSGMTQHIPPPLQSNGIPPDGPHTSIPTSLAVQETESQTTSSKASVPQHPSRHEPATPSRQAVVQSSATQPSQRDSESPETAQPLRSYTPVKLHDGRSHEKFPLSNSSSYNELQQLTNQSRDDITLPVATSVSQPDEGSTLYQSDISPTELSTIACTSSSKTQGRVPLRAKAPAFTAPSSSTPQVHESLETRSMSESHAKRSVTPPASYNKRISAPNVLEFRALPRLGRPGSCGSGWSEVSQPSPSRFLSEQQQQQQDDVFPSPHLSSQPSSQPEGNGASPFHSSTPVDPGSGNGTLFRKRLGSKKRLLSKFTGHRERSSSVVSWSVKRKKLNETIYEHRRHKLLQFPRELELEDGGKHPPRLTLYLHPYGYEDDAQNNLTLTLELDISVKYHIPSYAVIKVEVVATNGSDGIELKKDYISCSPDQRIARCKAFLSHKQLKELECETIDFRASAKLYSAISSTN